MMDIILILQYIVDLKMNSLTNIYMNMQAAHGQEEIPKQLQAGLKVKYLLKCQTANYNRVQQQIKIPSDTYQTARSCL